MRIFAGRLLNDGLLLYSDFFLIESPVSISVMSLLVKALEALSLGVSTLNVLFGGSLGWLTLAFLPVFAVPILSFICGLASLALVLPIIFSSGSTVATSLRADLPAYVSAFFLTILCCFFDFGDSQSFLLAVLLLWLPLRILRYEEVRIAKQIALLAGAFAALSIFCDPTAVIFWGFVEIFLLASTAGRQGRLILPMNMFAFLKQYLLRSEVVGFFLTSAGCLLYLGALPDATKRLYWEAVVPIQFMQFQSDHPAIYGPLSSPNRLDVIVCYLLASLLAIWHRRFSPDCLPSLLSVVGLAGLVQYVLQNEGLSRSLVLTVFSSFAIFLICGYRSLCLLIERTRALHWPLNFEKVFLILVVWLASGYLNFCLNIDRQALRSQYQIDIESGARPIEDFLLEKTKPGEKVAIIADFPEAAYPLLLSHDRIIATRLLSFRCLSLLHARSEKGALSPVLKDFYAKLLSELHEDLVDPACKLCLINQSITLPILEKAQIVNRLSDASYLAKQGPELVRFVSAGNRQPHEYFGYNYDFAVYAP